LAAAASQVDFPILTPSRLGEPSQVFLDEVDGHAVVTLLYPSSDLLPSTAETGVGLLVTEFGGTFEPFVEKLVRPGQAQRLVIDGRPAIWVQGPHTIFYERPDGEVGNTSPRLAASTMVVSRLGTTIRLEGAFPREAAVGLVQSLEPVPE
jgi:hypothetical protein